MEDHYQSAPNGQQSQSNPQNAVTDHVANTVRDSRHHFEYVGNPYASSLKVMKDRTTAERTCGKLSPIICANYVKKQNRMTQKNDHRSNHKPLHKQHPLIIATHQSLSNGNRTKSKISDNCSSHLTRILPPRTKDYLNSSNW